MKYFIFLTTIVFFLASFFSNSQLHITNPFIAYVFFQLDFVIAFFPLFFIAFCLTLFFIIRTHRLDQEEYLQQIMTAGLQVFAGFVVSGFFAFVLLLLLGIIELNIFAGVMNLNPKLLGVTTNTKTIASSLQKMVHPPKIIASDKDSQKEVAAIAQTTMGTHNFYADSLLQNIPNFCIFPIKNTKSLALIDNYLIVTSINIPDMQTISPIIGNLFVREYFSDRPIKFYPKVSVMTNKEYLDFEKKDVESKIIKLDVEINKMTQSISSISAVIKTDQDATGSAQTSQANSMIQRDKEYNTCLST